MSRILLSSLSLSFPLFSLLATDRTLILLSPSPRPLAIYLSKANSVGGEGGIGTFKGFYADSLSVLQYFRRAVT